MKRQNHGMSVKTDHSWPAEEIQEKIGLLRNARDDGEIDPQSLSRVRGKRINTSEDYQQAVAKMAYRFWEERGHPKGSDETDWFKAEATLKPLWPADPRRHL